MNDMGMHEGVSSRGERARARAHARWRGHSHARASEHARAPALAAPPELKPEPLQLWLRNLPKRPPAPLPPPDPQLWLLDWRPRPRAAEPPAPPRKIAKLPVIGPGPLSDGMREHLDRISEPVGPEALGLRRPRVRSECENGVRPCPWVSCRHHLYLDVNQSSGAIKLNHPFDDLDDMQETCSLDVADRGPVTLAEIAVHLNITLERVRQIEIDGRMHSAQRLGPDSRTDEE